MQFALKSEPYYIIIIIVIGYEKRRNPETYNTDKRRHGYDPAKGVPRAQAYGLFLQESSREKHHCRFDRSRQYGNRWFTIKFLFKNIFI